MMISKLLMMLLIVVSSCESTVTNDRATYSKQLNPQPDKPLETSEYLALIRCKQEKLGLDPIQGGFDSIQIRLWEIQGLFGNIKLTILKKDKTKWSSTYYQVDIDSNYSQGLDTQRYKACHEPFYVSRYKGLKPTISWNNLIDSLVHFNIMTLPDMNSIPNMEIEWTDAGSVIIEIAVKNYYRVYHYSDPWRFEEKFVEAREMMGIVSLIRTTLH